MSDLPTQTLTVNLEALEFTVVAEVHGRHRVDFKIYNICGYQMPENTPLWHKAGSDTSHDMVDKLSESEVYLHGQVKWDGCSDWHFDEQDRVMLHGCSRANIQRFGDVMGYCWDWASMLLPKFDR